MSKKIIVLSVVGGIFSTLYFGGTWIYDEFKGNHYDKKGFNRYGYDKNGYDKKGYDKDGYNVDGIDADGFNRLGYDFDGFNRLGFDKAGYNRDGFDEYGYDKNGYDKKGYDKDGYNVDGIDADGFNRLGYDNEGFNRQGFDVHCYNRDGFDKYGYDRQGYNSNGYDRAGQNRDYYNKALKIIIKDLSSHSKPTLKYRYKMLDYRFTIEKLLRMIIEHYKGKEILESRNNDFICRYIEMVYNEKMLDLTEEEKESIRLAKNYFGNFLHPKESDINDYKENKAIATVKMLYNKVQEKLDLQMVA